VNLDALVIGGGVVGLGIAAELSSRAGTVALVERHERLGQEPPSRNSEVIHAGPYYAAGSLKARLCVEGRRALYRLCEECGIRHRRCGKLIVATCAAEVEELEHLRTCGEANGVEGLRLLSAAEVHAREPRVRATAGLLSPETGIVNAHGLMDAYARRAAAAGGDVVCGAEVLGLAREADGWEVRYRDSEEEGVIRARW